MGEETRVGPIRGAALPMGFNRTPQYADGVLLVGDSAGAVNPFNGEGIAYALETGELAAEVAVRALAIENPVRREEVLAGYAGLLADGYGGYYTLGRWFVKLIGDPRVMKLATERGLSHPLLMRLVLKLLANLTDPKGGDAMDRIINALAKVVPDA
jgi:flavin-dependent dehydrogenase